MKKLIYIFLFLTLGVQAQFTISTGVVAQGTAVLQDIFPQDNAASINEVNSIGSFVSLGLTPSSDGTTSIDGSYSIRGEVFSAGSGKRIQIPVTVLNATTYNISVWAKRGLNNTDARINSWNGVITSPDISITTQTWTEYTFTVTTNDIIMNMAFYANRGSSVVGDTAFFDKITVIKQ